MGNGKSGDSRHQERPVPHRACCCCPEGNRTLIRYLGWLCAVMRSAATAARWKRCFGCVRECRRKEYREHQQQHRVCDQLAHARIKSIQQRRSFSVLSSHKRLRAPAPLVSIQWAVVPTRHKDRSRVFRAPGACLLDWNAARGLLARAGEERA